MRFKSLVLVLGLQTAWLLGTVVMQENSLAHGKIILLETERIDPRDMLRGDYLILNYKISSVPKNLFLPPITNDLPRETKVFVALTQGTNEFYAISRASLNEFTPLANEVLLKAKSDNSWWGGTNAIRVAYGLERFYVAEGTGNPSGKLTVQAIVPASGNAKIKEVFVNGKPYAEAMK